MVHIWLLLLVVSHNKVDHYIYTPHPDEISGYDAKACPIARGKFNSEKQGFGQVHGLI